MHHIYHIHGFILSSKNIGEANKIFTIYTREMGLVRAIAQGVRLQKSKLKFSLQDFSYSEIDLVRGRDIWRVTSARNITSFPYTRHNFESILLIARISNLLERLCDGEESDTTIFDDLIQSLYILDDENISLLKREAIELHLVLRIMNSLGYIGESTLIADYLSKPFDQDKIVSLLKDKKSIISHINKALNESQL